MHSGAEIRPWGQFNILLEQQNFKVKELVVNPGCKLSLQMHRHRCEHWVVVHGQAEVTVGNECRRIEAEQSVFIPCKARHRLANPGSVPLHVIEVQSGLYLGEDDIVRFEDDWGRA